MTLRSCIEKLRENQKTNKSGAVPYRNSKITHLFRNFFEGQGAVRMIVCINPRAADFDETVNVLQFAELTQVSHLYFILHHQGSHFWRYKGLFYFRKYRLNAVQTQMLPENLASPQGRNEQTRFIERLFGEFLKKLPFPRLQLSRNLTFLSDYSQFVNRQII